jgi:hypothetical protein
MSLFLLSICFHILNVMKEVYQLIIQIEEICSELNVLKNNVEEVRVSL